MVFYGGKGRVAFRLEEDRAQKKPGLYSRYRITTASGGLMWFSRGVGRREFGVGRLDQLLCGANCCSACHERKAPARGPRQGGMIAFTDDPGVWLSERGARTRHPNRPRTGPMTSGAVAGGRPISEVGHVVRWITFCREHSEAAHLPASGKEVRDSRRGAEFFEIGTKNGDQARKTRVMLYRGAAWAAVISGRHGRCHHQNSTLSLARENHMDARRKTHNGEECCVRGRSKETAVIHHRG